MAGESEQILCMTGLSDWHVRRVSIYVCTSLCMCHGSLTKYPHSLAVGNMILNYILTLFSFLIVARILVK